MSLKWSGGEEVVVVVVGSRQYDMSAVQTHNRQVFVAFQEKNPSYPTVPIELAAHAKRTFLSLFTVSHFIKPWL